MSVKGSGNLISKGFHFSFVAFDVKIDPAVGQVLHITRQVVSTGQTQDLGTKTDPLDVASIPDITMGDMG